MSCRKATSASFFDQRVLAPDAVLVRELDGESVLLHLDRESYFGLDDVGTRMWQVLTTAASVEAAYQALLAEYNVDPDLLRRDLADLVQQLVEQGLLEVAGG